MSNCVLGKRGKISLGILGNSLAMEADEVPHRVLPRGDFTRLSTIRERSSRSSSDDSDFRDLPLPPVPPRNRGTSQHEQEDPKTASTEFLYSRMEDFDDEPAAASREDLRAIDSDRSTSNTLQKSSWSSSCSVDEGILYLDAGDEDDDDEERSSAYRDKSPILRSLSTSPSRLLQTQQRTQRRRRRTRRRRAGD